MEPSHSHDLNNGSQHLFLYGNKEDFPQIIPVTPLLDGWMDDLRFYVLFNSISVISRRCWDDNERLCAMEIRLRMKRFHLE